MNKLYFLLLSLLTCSFITAQYSDDFESYDVNTYIGSQADEFTTWSGTTGTAEDALVVDTKANSGTKSIYFYSTGQGPQDVVLDFGQKYTTGVFNLTFSLFISEDASAYWNFQQETAIGQVWAGNAYMRNNGILSLDAGSTQYNTPFTSGQWNKITYVIDLDNGEWVIQINDECVGVLIAPAAVASLDIYPIAENAATSEFWIDDVSFSHDPTPATKTVDIALSGADAAGAAFVDNAASVKVNAVNTGETTVNTMTVSVSVDGAEIGKEELTGLDLMPGEETEIVFTDVLNASQGVNSVLFSLDAIEGLPTDDQPCNNRSLVAISGINKTPGKRVMAEELTGTWCPWCPRGDVFMNLMTEKYGDLFVGVAVHGANNDPMIVDGYAEYLLGFSGIDGYPSVAVDRSVGLDPAGMETAIIERLQETIPATFGIKATFDEDLNELVATVTVTALEDIPSSRRIGFILTEDNVVGTTSAYNQANAYAGGTTEMGGYEDLPNPVPFTDMVYQHVARAILPANNGIKLEEAMEAGDVEKFVFGLQLDDEIIKENLHLIAFIAAPLPTREILNTYSVKYDEALANTTDTEISEIDISFEVTPNPMTESALVTVQIENPATVSMNIYDAQGGLVNTKNYGTLSGKQVFDFNATSLSSGIYMIQILVDGQASNKKIVVTN